MRPCLALTALLLATLGAGSGASARSPQRTPVLVAADRPQPLIAQNSCSDARDRMFDWAAYWAVQSHMLSYRGRLPHTKSSASRSAAAPAADASASPAPAGAAAEANSAGPGHYTGTNVQERGVDEADMVKTDGKYVYTVSGREVIIVQSWPVSRARVVGRYQLPDSVTPQQLFLRGDTLVVLSYTYQQMPPQPAAKRTGAATRRIAHPYGHYFHGTRITVLDLEDRARPRVSHEADIEGQMAQARRIGSDIYLVSNAPMGVPAAISEAAARRARRLARSMGEARGRNYDVLRQRMFRHVRAQLASQFAHVSLDSAMPRVRTARAGGAMSQLRPLYRCKDLLVPAGGSQLGALNIVHFDFERPAAIDAVGLLASGWQIYASSDALYTAMPNYGWHHFWGWGAQPKGHNFNLTHIHKFDLGGSGDRPRYAATGAVRGHLLNQFSMSEHRGHLRVATTDQNRWGGGGAGNQSGNHLYVLAQRGKRLHAVGAIEDLAPGERIYSARMMGDKGYMVTFRQTDPLYTFDLSDPRRPRVVGELKINGFSSYIHPLGSDHLLTIGQDADDSGRVLGAHLQVFDVSDPANPRRTAHRRLADQGGWSWSAAQWDHHAFTYDPRTRVLAVPMSSYHHGDASRTFLGVVLLQVAKNGFEELGRISHQALADTTRSIECAGGAAASSHPCANRHQQPDWRSQIQRSIVMDEVLVTISQLGLQWNSLVRPKQPLAGVAFARPAVALAR